MAKALSKSQLIAAIADKAALSKKQAGEILDHLASLAYKHAKDTFTPRPASASSSSRTAPPAWVAIPRPEKPSRSKPSAS